MDVDMDEPRDPHPATESSTRQIGAAATLPTAQQAHVDYTGHAESCERCRDIDRGRCTDGEALWKAWNTALDDAYQQLHGGRP